MTREQLVFRAALSRIALGGAALLLLPALFPKTTSLRFALLAYLVLALGEQLLIARRVGGLTRSFLFGLVDLALLTFLVHRTGSVATPLVSLYFFGGILNALVVGLRVGISQAVFGSLMYATVLLLEVKRVLPYGPDAHASVAGDVPGLSEGLASIVLVTLMLFTSTGVVGLLQRTIRDRERALLEANARLEELSRIDPLTGLCNRRHLVERIEEGLAFARRGKPLALVMIDLDGFKRVNDTQGHLRGDMLLREIGEALKKTTRATDIASRYGGDEFVVLLPDTDESQARVVAERMVASIRDLGLKFASGGRSVTASVGLAMAHQDDAVATLLRRADEQAYRAKQSGGDRYVLAA